ncbi:septation protein IspZ [Rhizobium sp. MC63]|uniref:Septation protein IspZ n=1 Tax=Rhizobium mulingense TaxID=3031128 RepID=A0ACC6MRX1_9HYPH|nr:MULTISPECIES: septation protein IspZ [unclassified Rhizobium]MDF0696292.1 septation protein IspZ [Rhizobium sp. MC63]MEA3515888.1 septation protein IspZ [Rhizobium sp. MJ31]
MKAFLQTARLLSDLASSLLFLILFSFTRNAALSAGFGMLLGVIQIALQLGRRKPIDVMEWMSVFLVIASGTATVLTDSPRFVLFKPTAIYAIVGIVMLKPGWINRYLPSIAREVASDVGFAWAGLMFVSATLNAYLALNSVLATWAMVMTIFGIVGKFVLGIAGFVAIRLTVRHRLRAMSAEEREALLISTGWKAKSPPVAEK